MRLGFPLSFVFSWLIKQCQSTLLAFLVKNMLGKTIVLIDSDGNYKVKS